MSSQVCLLLIQASLTCNPLRRMLCFRLLQSLLLLAANLFALHAFARAHFVALGYCTVFLLVDTDLSAFSLPNNKICLLLLYHLYGFYVLFATLDDLRLALLHYFESTTEFLSSPCTLFLVYPGIFHLLEVLCNLFYSDSFCFWKLLRNMF